jgi:predicted ABC-type ATPase
MSNEEILINANNDIKELENLTDEDIIERAFEQIKSMKHTLPNKVLDYKNNKANKIIFMAGSPGAGKTEVAKWLEKKLSVDSIDTDEIRKFCDDYNGIKSHLFQKASSRGVSILINYAFKNNISFILDGNFAEYDIQKQNIERALKHNYDVEINYIYRPFDVAKKYTEIREMKTGRKVPDDVFLKKSLGAVDTVNNFIETIKVNFYDLTKNKIIENISKKKFNDLLEKDLINLQGKFAMKEIVANYKDHKKELKEQSNKPLKRNRNR